MSLYRLHSIVHDSTALPITKISVGAGGEIRAQPAGAAVFAQFAAMVTQSPRLEFDTESISAALALCALSGTRIAGLTNGLIIYLAKLTDGGGVAAGSVHRKITIKSGILVPQTLTCSSGGDATLSFQAQVTYNGVNAPYVLQENQALPSVDPDDDKFTLGACAVGGATIADLEQATLDFGLSLITKTPDSGFWPTKTSIVGCVPKLTLKGCDPEWFKSTNVPLAGLACTHANTHIYFRKRSNTGFIADNVAEHVKFTLCGTAHIPNPFQAGAAESGDTDLELVSYQDGSANDPVIPYLDVAIT